jgi:hypothetical protein
MTFFLDLLFGAVGTGYLVYAKRQHSARFAIAGAMLLIYPYLIDSALATVAIGVSLTIAPFLYDRLSPD